MIPSQKPVKQCDFGLRKSALVFCLRHVGARRKAQHQASAQIDRWGAGTEAHQSGNPWEDVQVLNPSAKAEVRLLPEPFQDLEGLARTWALPTDLKRSEQRDRSAFSDMKAFYDQLLGRIESIFEHLNSFPMDALPEDAKRLLYLTLSLAEVTPTVLFYKEERPAHAVDPKRIVSWPVPNMSPLI